MKNKTMKYISKSKTHRSKTHRKDNPKTMKMKINKNFRITQKNREYKMQPIYGGEKISTTALKGLKNYGNAFKSLGTLNIGKAIADTAKGTYYTGKTAVKIPTRALYHGVYSPVKYIGKKTLGIATAPVRGLARNSGRAFNNVVGNNTNGPNGPVDITYAIGNLKNSILSGFNIGNQPITRAEKDNIIKALGYLKDNNKINPAAYAHAIKQINKKDGVLGIVDTVGSVLSPLQGMVKVIGEWLIPLDINNLQGRRTEVKVLQFPKSSKRFGKSNKGLELTDNIVLVKDFFPSTMDKIGHELASVDNYLGNDCYGENCESTPNITSGLTHEIEITNNVSKKKILKEKEERDREDTLQNSVSTP